MLAWGGAAALLPVAPHQPEASQKKGAQDR